MREDLIEERRRKLERYRKFSNPYPTLVRRDLPIGEAIKCFVSLSRSKRSLTVVGRLFGLRNQGKIVFADLRDESGSLQLVLDDAHTKGILVLKEALDIGDFVEARGVLFKTKRGERSLLVSTARVIAKSLRPLPATWYGLEDTETRLRKRYLDLLLHPEVRELFLKKSRFWESARSFLKREGFLEVETPVLELVPGGADAKPFTTHHDALNTDFYLRISLELPLKKLLVAGFERVFEIGRIFRNEGIDREHLQDYTQLEFYWAYHDYRDLMKFVRSLFQDVVKATCGSLVTSWQGQRIRWGGVWPTVDYVAAFKRANRIDPLTASSDMLQRRATSLGIAVDRRLGKGRLIDLIYKKTVRPKLIQPVFLMNPPIELVPLTKRSDRDPRVGERMQPVACGTELGTGFTELNDPLDQRSRFEAQMKLREAGDDEAQRMDEDFIEALEYGMPPAAGFGMSERLFATLMDRPIREAVLFPLMRGKRAPGANQPAHD